MALGFGWETYNLIFSWEGSGVSVVSLSAPAIGPLISLLERHELLYVSIWIPLDRAFGNRVKTLVPLLAGCPGTWFQRPPHYGFQLNKL